MRWQVICTWWTCCLAAGLAAGAARGEVPAAAVEPAIEATERDHWAWRPLVRPEVPDVGEAGWCRNPIDRFVLARLEAEGLRPSPPADPRSLARRLTYDLTGLPPGPRQIDEYLADTAAGAYERLVERLLAAPAYGERMGQLWLDLARYADSDGFEHDQVRPAAWKYRDWVIGALQRDLPYDEFVQLQLAGDLLRPGNEAAATATGFCLCGPDMPDLNSQQERRHLVLNELTATVGAVVLGVQVGCAQCHDHKFDPLSQADFYRLRAVFEGSVPLADTPHGRTLQGGNPGEAFLWLRGDYRRPGPRVEPAVPRIVPASGPIRTRADLARELTRADHPLTTRAIVNRLWQMHFGRGLCETPSDMGHMGDRPALPALLDWLATELPARGWSLKSLHRLLVTSSAYRQASNLADAEEDGDAARRAWQAAAVRDPQNRLWWRAERRRLEAEQVRDAVLAASGQLSTQAGGPGVMVPLPAEALAASVSAAWKADPDPGQHRRRSIYLLDRRSLSHPLLEVFDRPDANASCPRRGQSTTATQALALLNSELTWDAARALARQVLSEWPGDAAAQVRACFRLALAREPDAWELARCEAFLRGQRAELSANGAAAQRLWGGAPSVGSSAEESAALAALALGVFNLSEFVYVD